MNRLDLYQKIGAVLLVLIYVNLSIILAKLYHGIFTNLSQQTVKAAILFSGNVEQYRKYTIRSNRRFSHRRSTWNIIRTGQGRNNPEENR